MSLQIVIDIFIYRAAAFCFKSKILGHPYLGVNLYSLVNPAIPGIGQRAFLLAKCKGVNSSDYK